ncbi:MAG: restriction endonuclease [Candidatus Dormibacter sp.]
MATPSGLGTWVYWKWAAFAIPTLAFVGAYVIAMTGLVNLVEKVGWRRLLDQQRSGEDIRALPWHEFERFVGAAFAAHGWKVEIVGKPGPDGGIDIRLQRKKEKAIVQCKQRRWQQGFVGERDVREFVGLITAEKASRGFFVTSGFFSPQAVEFAAKVPKLELVAADDLFRMMGRCPECGSEMVFKNGSRGPFMSCVRYPECRGSADLPSAA